MKFGVIGASLLVFSWASMDVLSAAFASDGPTGLDNSKYVECIVEVSGGELERLTVLDKKKIELKFQEDLSWVGTGEFQIDPMKKHNFKLRKTQAPGIDLITKLSNGMEIGFFGVTLVEINFEQAGYATHLYCKDFQGPTPAPALNISNAH